MRFLPFIMFSVTTLAASLLLSDDIKPFIECYEGYLINNQKPATVATLDVEGVSIINCKEMAFPVGHVLPMGQPGDISNYTPSEALGYAMRNAVKAKDKTFFQRLLNGYLYLVNQTTLYRQNQQHLPADMLAIGLIGWSPNIANISSGLSPYDFALPNSFVSSASDADIDIITAMIDAASFWGDMIAIDPLSIDKNTISSIGIQSLVSIAIESFVKNELGNFTLNQQSYYGLTLDNWGHDVPNPDYFDPTAFAKMIQFVGSDSALVQALYRAAQGTIHFINNVSAQGNGWIPNTPWNNGEPTKFGYDAVRILMRFGEYILSGHDPLNSMDSVIAVLKVQVQNLFSGGYLMWERGTLTFSPSGLTLGQFTGPLSVALKALQKTNNLPSNVAKEDVSKVQACLNHDLTQYQIDTTKDWQQCYFSIELALLCRAIILN